MRVGLISMVLAAGSVVSGFAFTSCVVDDTLDDRLWRCDVQAKENECGDEDGRQMACWQDYCMSSCDPNDPPDDDGVVCLDRGVLLEKCRPSKDDCPENLNCYRRNLLADEGLCVPFPVCEFNEQCEGQRRNACAGQVLREHLGEGVAIESDHFQCVQDGCSEEEGGGCADGETCLNASYRVADRYPDICLPRCDREDRCLPNFACMHDDDAAPGADRICVPGLPGVRCNSDLDCVVGRCVDLGVGFNICTGEECQSDADCVLMNRPPMYFVCAGNPGAPKYCVNPTPFNGAECNMKAPDCPDATPKCFDYSPSLPFQDVGECRRDCDPDGTCPVRGGLPHVCLKGGEGGCYPGTFGIPCSKRGECVPPLDCEEVEPDGREREPSPRVCTLPCDSDADCDDEPITGGSAYCGGGFCRVPGLDGAPCEKNDHCRSARCLLPKALSGAQEPGEMGECVP